MEKKAEHKSTTVKQVWLCGIEFKIVGTSGTIGARGIINELIALKSCVQGSRFFIIRHIHNHTSIISSEMQVELKKNTAFTWGKGGEKKTMPRLCSLGSTVWEQEKHLSNTKAHTRHSHRGSESGPASSHLIPQPLIRRWSDPLDQASGSKRTEANGRGGGGQCL